MMHTSADGLHGGAQEQDTVGKQLRAAGKRKVDDFQAFADGTMQDADRCVAPQT